MSGDKLLDDPATIRDSEILSSIASGLDSTLNRPGKPKEIGFMIVLFPFDPAKAGHAKYISNGEATGTVDVLRKLADALEERRNGDRGNRLEADAPAG